MAVWYISVSAWLAPRDLWKSSALQDIARIYGLGVTTGTSSTTYDPHGLVTREQIRGLEL